MAQLKDSIVQGSLRVTDTIYTTDLAVTGSKTAKYVLAAPTNDAGVPTWRTLSNSDVGLGNVENTKLSTWTGSSNIATVGTITTGTWSGTAIAVNKGGTGATTASAAWTALGGGDSGKHADNYYALASHGTHVSYGTSTAKIGTASAGSATTVSRTDHVHAIDLATGDSNGQVKIAGTNVSVGGTATMLS